MNRRTLHLQADSTNRMKVGEVVVGASTAAPVAEVAAQCIAVAVEAVRIAAAAPAPRAHTPAAGSARVQQRKPQGR